MTEKLVRFEVGKLYYNNYTTPLMRWGDDEMTILQGDKLVLVEIKVGIDESGTRTEYFSYFFSGGVPLTIKATDIINDKKVKE